MSKIFSYSVLQHHYSSLIDEVVNIGVLFSFPEDNISIYKIGNINRIKCLYSEFDHTTISRISESIEKKVSRDFNKSLFLNLLTTQDELHSTLLRPDDSSIQFSKPKKVPYPFTGIDKIVDEYSKLLLPNLLLDNPVEPVEHKHNEIFIIKKYVNSVLQINNRLEKFFRRNTQVVTNTVALNFEYGWKNGSTNLVKAVSFDLKEEINIQNKGMQYYGYLTKLNDYAKLNNYRYDIIVGKPQEEGLRDAYDKAVENLNSANSKKQIITEEDLEEYSNTTAKYLAKELEESLED